LPFFLFRSDIESAEMKRAHALMLRAKGMKQREIAAEMGVSLRSVKDYLKSGT
jgi:predicted transcriptional regulator